MILYVALKLVLFVFRWYRGLIGLYLVLSLTSKTNPRTMMTVFPRLMRSERMTVMPIVMRRVMLSRMRWRTSRSRTNRGLLLPRHDTSRYVISIERSGKVPKMVLCRLCRGMYLMLNGIILARILSARSQCTFDFLHMPIVLPRLAFASVESNKRVFI